MEARGHSPNRKKAMATNVVRAFCDGRGDASI